MSKHGEEDPDQDTDTGDTDLASRLQSSTDLTSDSSAESDERRAVDKLSKQLRGDGEEPSRLGNAPSPTLHEPEEGDDGASETADDFEDVLLDALDSDDGGTPPRTGRREGETPLGAEVGDTAPASSQTDQQVVDPSKTSSPPHESEETDDGIACPNCESSNPSDTRFCVQCGERLDAEESDEGDRRERSASDIRVPPPDRRDGSSPGTELTEGIQLVCIRDDGSDGKAISIESKTTIIGRDGDQRFPTDDFLNPKHARLIVEGGHLYVEDLHSLNGTFIKIRGEVQLKPGDTFLMGRQVLRFEKIEEDYDAEKTSPDGTRYMGSPPPGGDYKILQLGAGDLVQDIYCLPESGVVLGREKGDIVFPEDKFMSGRHARIVTDDACHLVDLNSSNGTWIKLWKKTKLKDEDYLFMGQQLFRMERD